jgi:hypothetical protein
MRLISMAAIAVVALSLGSCAKLQDAWETATTAKVPATVVIVAANSFNAVQSTATNYIRFCTPNPAPVGCSDEAIQKLIPAIRSGRTARDSMETFLTDHPGELGPRGLYDALVTSTDTISTILAQYKKD